MRTFRSSLLVALAVTVFVAALVGLCACGKSPAPASTPVPTAAHPAPSKAATVAATATAVPQPAATGVPAVSIPALGTPAAAAATYQAGDVLSIGDLTLAVLGWHQTVDIEGKGKAGAGNKFVAVDTALLNRGRQELELSLYRIKLRDAGAQEYAAMVGFSGVSTFLNPGDPERADLVFEVPESSEGFVLLYPLSQTGKDYALVNPGAEGVSADLPQELRIQQTNAQEMGQAATYGDLQLAVVGWQLSPGTAKDQPAPGMKLVMVDIVLRNGGSQPVDFAPSDRLMLRDSDLRLYPQDRRFSILPEQASLRRVEASPGEALRFRMAFQVPEASGGYVLRFYDSFGSNRARVYMKLSSEPGSVAIPSPIAGAAGQDNSIGKVVYQGDLAAAVLRWGTPEAPGKNDPGAGQKFVVVDFMVVNRGSASRSFMEATLTDSNLGQYPSAWDYSFGDFRYLQFPTAVDIAPGERARGQMVFRVPQASSDYVFALDTRSLDGGDIVVPLGPTPVEFDPPAELLTPNPNAHRIGEVIKQGDAALAVLGWAVAKGNDQVPDVPGYQFIVVDLLLVNRGPESNTYSPSLRPRLRDANGYRFEASSSISYGGQDSVHLFEAARTAGQRLRGQFVFQALADSRDCVFIFDPRWLFGNEAGDPIVVNLGSQPVSVEPPAELLAP